MATQNISAELTDGIKAYERRIEPLLGKTVTIQSPDGKTHTGIFGEASRCQPIVTQADGRRFLVVASELDRLVAEVSS